MRIATNGGISMNLYQNLRAQRLNKGLTQEEVANYLNLSRQTISKWEQGKSTPSIEDLTRLCGLYETTLDQITQAKIDDDNKSPKK